MLQPESEREAVPAALAESKACGTQGRASEFLIDMSWRELQCAAVFSKLGTAIGESGRLTIASAACPGASER